MCLSARNRSTKPNYIDSSFVVLLTVHCMTEEDDLFFRCFDAGPVEDGSIEPLMRPPGQGAAGGPDLSAKFPPCSEPVEGLTIGPFYSFCPCWSCTCVTDVSGEVECTVGL